MSVKCIAVGRFSVGIFSYWIGFSNRHLGPQCRTIDIGFIKIMWSKP